MAAEAATIAAAGCLLSGTHRSLETVDDWLSLLRTELREDEQTSQLMAYLETGGAVPTTIQLSEDKLYTFEDLSPHLERDLVTIHMCISKCAVMARNLSLCLAAIPAASRSALRATTHEVFIQARSKFCDEFGLTEFAAGYDNCKSPSSTKFWSATEACPVPLWLADEERFNYGEWELNTHEVLSDEIPPGEKGEGLPLRYLFPWVSPHYIAFYLLANMPVRCLYLHLLEELGIHKGLRLQGVLRDTLRSQEQDTAYNWAVHIRTRAKAEVPLHRRDDSNVPLVYKRLNALATAGIITIVALEHASVDLEQQLQAHRATVDIPPVHLLDSTTLGTCKELVQQGRSIIECFQMGKQHRMAPKHWRPEQLSHTLPHAASHNNSPVQIPVNSGVVSSLTPNRGNLDAMKYIAEILKPAESQFKMPKREANHKTWEEWFQRITSLEVILPGTPASVIVQALTTSISIQDPRIYGWHEIVEAAAIKKESITLGRFLSHVKGRVMTVSTSRKAAFQDLTELNQKVTQLPDLQALSVKLKLLYCQIFPASTDEVAPATHLECIRIIHKLLLDLKQEPRLKYPIVRAWRDHTQYDSTQMFNDHISSKLHPLGQPTEAKVKEYLDECTHTSC